MVDVVDPWTFPETCVVRSALPVHAAVCASLAQRHTSSVPNIVLPLDVVQLWVLVVQVQGAKMSGSTALGKAGYWPRGS